MLVVVSDLHFQDTELSGAARVGHNITASSYREFFESIKDAAEECGAKDLGIVLNGDIFDFLRTERWFGTTARPYDDVDLSSEARGTIVEILDRACRINAASLKVFRAVAANDSASLGFSFPVRPRFEYIPGNHDRHLHLVPEAAERVRSLLGLAGPFRQRLILPEYRVLVRHGHEYDWLNSEYNFEFLRRDAGRLDDSLYRRACLGDWLAIDVATRIPYEFKRLFGNDPGAADVYRAIVEIDDVRPLTSVFRWLQSVTGEDTDAWRKVRRAIEEALSKAFADEFVQRWIRSHDRPGFLDRVDFFKYVIKPLSRHAGLIPDSMIQSVLNLLRGKEDRTSEDRILGDVEFADSGMSLLCHGHYHDGGVSFLESKKAVICTGSWRAQHSLCHDGHSYFKGRCLSYAVFYAPHEIHRRGGSHHSFSFEYHHKFAAA